MPHAETDIQALAKTLREKEGLECRHAESVPVTEVFKGQMAWEWTVEVFTISGHPKGAQRAFAWRVDNGAKTQDVIVVELPPVDGPQTAVKVAIAAKARGH